jgi:predicted phosphodiesterase
MKGALIADVHGNFVALQAVLDELEREGIELLACLGDVAEAGPQPSEAIERLRSLGCPVVLGNTDAHLAEQRVLAESKEMYNGPLYDIDRWTLEQISGEQLDWLGSLPPTTRLDLGGEWTMLCFHGSPRSYDDRIEPTTSERELAAMLADSDDWVMAGGHTHHQMLRRWRRCTIVNPGSVGLALARPTDGSLMSQLTDEDAGPVLAAHAEYAIVSVTSGIVDIDLRHTPFDREETVAAARRNSMPHADWWAAKWAK